SRTAAGASREQGRDQKADQVGGEATRHWDSDGDGRLYRRMRIVADEFEILELEVVNVLHCGIQSHRRERPRLARELQFRLLEVVRVKVQITKRVDKRAALQAGYWRDHQREQRTRGNVERHAQE